LPRRNLLLVNEFEYFHLHQHNQLLLHQLLQTERSNILFCSRFATNVFPVPFAITIMMIFNLYFIVFSFCCINRLCGAYCTDMTFGLVLPITYWSELQYFFWFSKSAKLHLCCFRF
jgi:hypothetical protein